MSADVQARMKGSISLFLLFLVAGVVSGNPSLEAVAAKPGKCLLVVDGKTYISGQCKIEMASDGTGSFQIFENTKRLGYFAQVQIDSDGAVGYWNEEKGANHAHSPLGALKRKGGCWENERARVCAWK